MIALGSNVGDRAAHLEAARAELRAGGFPWSLASRVVETEPLGGPPGQRPYLNQMLAAPRRDVTISAENLLRLGQLIEESSGRVKTVENGPRTLDVDILFFGDLVRDDPELTIPHPRVKGRSFVLEPLSEILPQLVCPTSGKTVEEMRLALVEAGGAAGGEARR